MSTVAGTGAARIAEAFSRAQGRAALMPYLMGGYPDVETSRRDRAGVCRRRGGPRRARRPVLGPDRRRAGHPGGGDAGAGRRRRAPGRARHRGAPGSAGPGRADDLRQHRPGARRGRLRGRRGERRRQRGDRSGSAARGGARRDAGLRRGRARARAARRAHHERRAHGPHRGARAGIRVHGVADGHHGRAGSAVGHVRGDRGARQGAHRRARSRWDSASRRPSRRRPPRRRAPTA